MQLIQDTIALGLGVYVTMCGVSFREGTAEGAIILGNCLKYIYINLGLTVTQYLKIEICNTVQYIATFENEICRY